MTRTHVIDTIAGGVDITDVVVRGVDDLAAAHDFTVRWRHPDWNSDRYRRTGYMMPTDGIDQLRDATPSSSALSAPRMSPTTSLCGDSSSHPAASSTST